MNRLRLADRLAGLAGGLTVVAAAAGLAVPGVYRDVPFWAQQARGTDVATLFLAVPALLAGLVLARRGTASPRLVVVAALLYLVYNYAIFAFSVAMNPLTPIYIAILGLAVYSLGLTLVAGDLAAVGMAARAGLPARTVAAALTIVATLFGLLWLGQIAAATFTGVLPADLVRAELPTNPVYALDLGLFLPLCLIAAFGLARGYGLAGAFAIPMLIWLSLTSAGIVAAFALAASSGDVVPLPVAGMIAAIGLATAALAAVGLRRSAVHVTAIHSRSIVSPGG
jgi:hypothetical protein